MALTQATASFKTTELSKENQKLKKSSQDDTDGQTKTRAEDSTASRNEGLLEELQVVRSERDRAVREEKSLRQSVSILEQEREVHVHT